MYKFHYDYMQPKYVSKVKSCYMDTDSLVHENETRDCYRGVAKNVETEFDTTGYLKDYDMPLQIGWNMKVIGIMKDELGGKDKKLEDKCSEDTKKRVVPVNLTFDYYKAYLFKGETIYREQMLLENKKHVVHTVNKHIIALNRDDDKRLLQANGAVTLARRYLS